MERKQVTSSNINSIGFDEQTLTLEIEFYNLKVYQYSPITREGYNQLMNADSINSYFSKNIRNNPDIKVTQVG